MRPRSARRSRKRTALVILCLVLVLSTSGCWDYHPVTTRALVVGMAVDKGETGQGRYEVTLQIVIPQAIKGAAGGGAGGAAAGGPPFYITSANGETFLEALKNLQTVNGRQIFLGHVRVVIFGEGLAMEGLRPIVEELARYAELDKAAFSMIARGAKGKDILALSSPPDKMASTSLHSTFTVADQHPNTVRVRLAEFYIRGWEPGFDQGLPTVFMPGTTTEGGAAATTQPGGGGQDRTEPVVGGVALLNDQAWRLVDWLSFEETTGLLYLLGKAEHDSLRLGPSESGEYDEVLHLVIRRKVRLITEGGQIRFRIDLMGKGRIGEVRSTTLTTTEGDFVRIQNEAARAIEAQARETLRRLQEAGSDVLGLGSMVLYQRPELWEKIDWSSLFPTVPVEVRATVRLKRKGLIS